MEENNKNDFNKLFTYLKTPRGKAILFFGFYLVFFIFVFSLFSGGEKSNRTITTIEKITNAMSHIEKNNYHFKYTISNDNHDYIYEGKRYNNKIQFASYSDELVTNYQCLDDICFKEIDNLYIKNDSPLYPNKLFDIKEIKRIIKNSKLYSKTEYEGLKYEYNYQISLNNLIELLDDEKTVDNKELVSVSIVLKEDTIERIEIDATNYYKYLKNESLNYKITMEHSDLNKISNFDLIKVVE